MSNSVRRPPLRGVIIRGDRIVGGLDLPTPSEPFIAHFNREYAAAGLCVVPADALERREAIPPPPLPEGLQTTSPTATQSL